MAMDSSWQADQFEQHRAHLRAVAYRMLGSLSDADDAVQEAWLRLSRSDGAAIENVGGWLTTVVGRVCIDMLRARRARREQYVGSWLPEPVVSVDERATPEQETLLADSVGLALLVVLETLTPAERLAFVLHDTFGVPFEDIAPMIDRTPAAARQLASRARRRVRGAPTVPDADLAKQREIVAAFLSAARGGDFETLLRLLDPDVVFRADSGMGPVLAPPLIVGRDAVAQTVATQGPRYMPYCEPAIVNGAAGLVVRAPGRRQPGVIGIKVVDGRITEIDLILDEDKLRRVDLED
jgi:RNA polymerase sigma factor (sigma-70 family)